MGIFNFFNSNKTSSSSTGEFMNIPSGNNDTDNYQEHSFLARINVGDRDLSKPIINDDYIIGNGMVYFGEDNLFPNLINNLYLSSSIHATCINFKTSAIMGGGYEWEGVNNDDLSVLKNIKKFERITKFKKLIKTITKDFIKHNRAIILLRYDKKEQKYVSAKVLDPENVRNDKVGVFKDLKLYFISDDFTKFNTVKEVKPYSPDCVDEWQILELRGETGGSPTYPLPDYVANGNWTYLDGEISYLYKQGIVNSINPSMIFKFPFETTPEVKSKIKKMLTFTGKGAKNMGRIFTFFKPKDQQPEIETVQTTSNDKLYSQVSKEIKDNIIISHQLNPSIIGVKVAGQLGNTEEIRVSYQIFEKNWVMENRYIIESFINELVFIFGLNAKFVFNTFNIIDDEIVETDI